MIRDKVSKYSLISTVMHGITLVFIAGVLIMLIVLTFLLSGWIGESAGLMENVNPDDVTAGWQVLFGAGGSLFGAFAWILIVAMIILLIGPLIAETVAFIYGIHTYRKRDTADFTRMVRNDSIIKLIFSTGMLIMCFLAFPSSKNVEAFVGQLDDYVKIFIFSIPSLVSIIVSILALRNTKYIEGDLPIYDGR